MRCNRLFTTPSPLVARSTALSLLAGAALTLAACSKSESDVPTGDAIPTIAASSLGGRLIVGPISSGGGQLLEQEPNDTPSQVQFVGDIGPGDHFVITGDSTDDGSDPFDGFRFRTTEPISIHVEIEMLTGGTDLDGSVFDVQTGDLLCSFIDVTNPEVGDCTLGVGGFDFDLVVYSFLGSTAYVLRVDATSAQTASSTPAAIAKETLASGKQPDVAARYLGAHHPMADGRIVALESDAAFSGPERAAWLAAQGLELVSRTADGTSIYRLLPTQAALLPKGAPGAWLGSLEHEVARKAWILSRQPGVRAASPDYRMQAFGEPDDTHYPLQWHYPQVRLPLAWDLETGSELVIVAVLDTGSTSHPDLAPRLIGGYDFISTSETSNDGDGMDADPSDAGDGSGPQPSTWHGTHVSGTIGASTQDQEGVAGVDWHCGIMSLRVLGIGGGTIADISAGIRYAAGLPNASGTLPTTAANVVNMSLGGPGFSTVLEAACADAFEAGVTLVAAAGNQPDSVPKYPAAHESVIGVGAVRYDKQLAPYSSFGSWVDLVAPGGDMNADQNGDGFPDGVLSTHKDEEGAFNYSFQQGTSMACPHVAGIVALLLATEPDATPTELVTLLRSTAQDLGAPGADPTFGFGLVDAYAALTTLSGGGPSEPVLAVNPTTVNFGTIDTFFPVSLANVGGDVLTVTSADVQYSIGSGWLSAILTPSSVLTNISHGYLDLSVDRALLEPGSYSATVMVNAEGLPSQPVQVLMSVGGGALPDYPTFVLLVNADDYTTVDQSTTDLTMSYDWRLEQIPAGRYLVVAGTDVDDDGFIGDAGEPLFGLWPSALDPTVILVQQPAAIEGLDFPVSTSGNIGSLGFEGTGGFVRLR